MQIVAWEIRVRGALPILQKPMVYGMAKAGLLGLKVFFFMFLSIA
jgi:hypothetical protein